MKRIIFDRKYIVELIKKYLTGVNNSLQKKNIIWKINVGPVYLLIIRASDFPRQTIEISRAYKLQNILISLRVHGTLKLFLKNPTICYFNTFV